MNKITLESDFVLSQINESQSSGSCLEEFTKEEKVIFLLFTRELDYLAIKLKLAAEQKIIKCLLFALCRSSHPEVFLRKGGLEICIKFTGEHPCRIVILIKLLCPPVNLLHIFRTPSPRNTSAQVLLIMSKQGFGQNQ